MDKIEIWKLLNEQKERYGYNLITLCSSAVGFVVFITIEETYSYSLLPLACAVASWLYSIYFGLKYQKLLALNSSANLAFLDIEEGNTHLHDLKPQYQQAGLEGTMRAMKTNAIKSNTYHKKQRGAFYIGIIFFILWHLTEMAIRSHN